MVDAEVPLEMIVGSGEPDQLHRVRIGPQANRDAAATVAKKLESEGHKGQVVPHP